MKTLISSKKDVKNKDL